MRRLAGMLLLIVMLVGTSSAGAEFRSDSVRVAWARSISAGTASSLDRASAMTVDAAGNTYITGRSQSTASGYDWMTIKYSSGGTELWRARYDGLAHLDDYPNGIAVDQSGNVYVTGGSIEPTAHEPFSQFTVVKYSPAGHQLWVSGYRDIECAGGQGQYVVLDPSGDIVVSGTTKDRNGSWEDVATTLKFTPEGEILWCKREGGGSRDFGINQLDDFSCDRFGNIFLVGMHYRRSGVAIVYAPSGQIRWSADWSSDTLGYRAFGIAHDDSGHTYISGAVGTPSRWDPWRIENWRLFIARFDSTGTREWMSTVGEPHGMSVFGRKLMIADDGNIIFSGQYGSSYSDTFAESVLVAKFSPAGQRLWSHSFGDFRPGYWAAVLSPVCWLDRSGSVYLTYQTEIGGCDLALLWDSVYTIKLRGDGELEWIRPYLKPAGSGGELIGIFVDAGNSITVGGSIGKGRNSDFVTRKYQNSGEVVWENRATGDGASNTSFSAMTVDEEGNLYVAGSSEDATTSTDFLVSKLDPAGNELWNARFNSPENKLDAPDGIAVDGGGNVYVTGISRTWGGYLRTTVKYDPYGVRLWYRRSNRAWWWVGSSGIASSIHLDNAGNVIVAGGSGMTRYDPDGNVLWENAENVYAMISHQGEIHIAAHEVVCRLDSLGGRSLAINFAAQAVAVDDSGNIFATKSPDWGENQATRKFSPNGTLLWTFNQGGSQMKISPDGGAFIRKTIDWPAAQILKVDRNGIYQWAASTPVMLHGPIDFATDSTGGLYICGHLPSGLEAGSGDFYIAKYDPSGNLQWSGRYDSPRIAAETPYAIMVDRLGNILLGGTAELDDYTNAITIAKFSSVTVAVADEKSDIPHEFSLSQNYPNPFNPSTTIRFALPQAGHVELRISNIVGQEMATIVNEVRPAGHYAVQWNPAGVPSGVYFYTMTAGRFVETRKLVVLR